MVTPEYSYLSGTRIVRGLNRQSFIFSKSVGMSIVATVVLIGLSVPVSGPTLPRTATLTTVTGDRAVTVTDKYRTVLLCHLFSRDRIIIVDIQTTAAAILGQLGGIAPTLIAVRVGLGRSVENVERFVAAQMRADQSPLRYRMAAASRDSTGLPKKRGGYRGQTSKWNKVERPAIRRLAQLRKAVTVVECRLHRNIKIEFQMSPRAKAG
ncbi:hypothetical protein B0H13DRAFT_1900482 [Mycena leptocephala]|nr:hypothetical protein B0H13DRAFT_1900482 [Mycena leptocephala]